MKLGFTGTQNGMNKFQADKVDELIQQLDPDELHHGDCIGADAQTHFRFIRFHIANDTKPRKIVIHPPDKMLKRACCASSTALKKELAACQFPLIIEQRAEKPYLERNLDIVTETEVLIGTPKEHTHTLRSGTWSTIRKGWHQKKPVHVIPPLIEEKV